MCFPCYYSIDSSIVWLWFFEVPWFLISVTLQLVDTSLGYISCSSMPCVAFFNSYLSDSLSPYLRLNGGNNYSRITFIMSPSTFEPKFCPLFRYPHSTPILLSLCYSYNQPHLKCEQSLQFIVAPLYSKHLSVCHSS